MERVMTVLTDKEQTFLWSVLITGMSTYGARLACVVGIYLDRHTPDTQGFVGEHAMQLGKAPFGGGSIGLPLLFARLFALASLRSFANVGQIFQPDEGMGETGHDALGNDMIGVSFQPSLPSGNHAQATCGRTGAFLLQTLPQSRIMVGLGNKTLA